MVSELPSSMANNSNVLTEKPVARASPDKKNQVRVPKKIHKAEREKLKRDHLNELFLELGQTLEPTRQNNGKASILGDTTKLLRDLIAQVDSLTRENAALLNETHYVTLEKNELKDENAILEREIEKLQTEIRETMLSNPTWSNAIAATSSIPLPISTTLSIQPPPVAGSMYVIPLPQDQPCGEPAAEPPTTSIPSNVRRPHARYPTQADSWPFEIFSQQQPRVSNHSGSSSSRSSRSSSVSLAAVTLTSNAEEEERLSTPRELNLLN